MGNFNSVNTNTEKDTNKQFENMYEVIDFIASYYILTSDFNSLQRLSEKEYCDQLVVLTADIINNHFNDKEVTYLAQRIKNGQEINELTKQKFVYVNDQNLKEYDVSNDKQKSIKKKRICIGIAKFYVKIAHVFSAIVMTINPIYSYKDEMGNTINTNLLNKDKIPKNVNRRLQKVNICDNRIRALNKKMADNDKEVTMNPTVCDMNIDNDSKNVKSLADEPGINELLRLYLDDNYDYSKGVFTGMSENTKKQYMSDLKTFYTSFTGNETMPPEITKFSDIKLKDYSNTPSCKDNKLKVPYTVSKNDELFIQYATNIKNMVNNASNNQRKLLSVINSLFSFAIDPYTKTKKIRVNPKLTDELLQQNVEKTRKIIVELYVKCELDYVNGLKIYEAIVDKKILETTQNQIKNLQDHATSIINEVKQLNTTLDNIDNKNINIQIEGCEKIAKESESS